MFIISTFPIDNHNVIYVGKERPHQELLAMIIRPLIWINTIEENTRVFSLRSSENILGRKFHVISVYR